MICPRSSGCAMVPVAMAGSYPARAWWVGDKPHGYDGLPRFPCWRRRAPTTATEILSPPGSRLKMRAMLQQPFCDFGLLQRPP